MVGNIEDYIAWNHQTFNDVSSAYDQTMVRNFVPIVDPKILLPRDLNLPISGEYVYRFTFTWEDPLSSREYVTYHYIGYTEHKFLRMIATK
jgi:hypothetical protein